MVAFVEKAGRLVASQQVMEGVKMEWKSQVIEGWRQEGRLAMLREDVLLVLERRLRFQVPADLAGLLESTTDLAALSRWFDAAINEPSLDAFRSAIQSAPPTGQSNGTPAAP